MSEKARIAVLVSGGGTNLQALLDAQQSRIIKSGEIVLVVSSSKKPLPSSGRKCRREVGSCRQKGTGRILKNPYKNP